MARYLGMNASRLRWIDLSFGGGVALALVYVAILAGFVIAGPPANDLSVTRSSYGSSVVTPAPAGGATESVGVRRQVLALGAEPAVADLTGSGASRVVILGPDHIAPPRSSTGPRLLAVAAAGGLLILGLAGAWVPNVAGVLVLLSLTVSTVVVVPLVGPPLNAALLVPGPLAAAIYASDRRRRLHRAVPGVAGVAVLVVPCGWAVANAAPIDYWHLPTLLAVLAIVALGTLGLIGAMRPAFQRAEARRAVTGRTAPFAPFLADELLPGRSATRLSAIEHERARLATEIHADVLPDLSAAIRDIEAGAAPDDVTARLRVISGELRDLTTERRLGVLEDAGLAAAIEWLAEHTEARSDVVVELNLGAAIADAQVGRPPRGVESALFRIAQQAIDNAALHARPVAIRVRIDGDAFHVVLEVADDGVGIAPDAENRALRAGHLGISDMRDQAASIGAAFMIGPAPGGGTHVKVRWPA
jgi:signal transduction histidine kinase